MKERGPWPGTQRVLMDRPWSPDIGSSSCLPKEARIEYERQEKSVAGNSPYFYPVSQEIFTK